MAEKTNDGPVDDEQKSIILSETDVHGTIIFVNENFCNISGYMKEELIGTGHNIVRHPTMPRRLFEQMWSTIKQGKVFRAVIKNRTKNGGHYWVNATIMPVFKEDQIVGFIGGRQHIKDDQLAEILFQKQVQAWDAV